MAGAPPVQNIMEPDLPDVAALHAVCFEDVWRTDLLRRILESPRAFGLCVRENGDMTAFLLFRGASDEGEVLSLGVTPSRRRNGLARALMDVAMARARDMSISAIFLEVAEDNDAARGLYGRMGFRQAGRRTGYYRRRSGPSVDALTLKIDLEH